MEPQLDLKELVPTQYWHKTLVVVGFLLFAISLIFPATWLPSKQVGVLGFGFMLTGLGDWKIVRARHRAGKVAADSSVQDAFGSILWYLGIAFLLWSLAYFLWSNLLVAVTGG